MLAVVLIYLLPVACRALLADALVRVQLLVGVLGAGMRIMAGHTIEGEMF